MLNLIGQMLSAITRKKWVDLTIDTRLTNCLSTLDLTALGVGSTLGFGVYVVVGPVARDDAGPAIVISFAIAAIASLIAGLCYAEFGARVPKAGSAYIYSYITVGEFVAFVIGWTLISEYMIGAASVAKGLSLYVDALCNNKMQEYFETLAYFEGHIFAKYPDLFAFATTMMLSIAIAFGVKQSSFVNNLFTFVNLAVVVSVIGVGCFYAKVKNWKLKSPCADPDLCKLGKGGFAPYGFAGIATGAAKCFYLFFGFDSITAASEEAKNPKESIPISLVGSLIVVFLAYVGVSAVLTLTLPYYEQNESTPLAFMFDTIGWGWAKWPVSIGAICAICASLSGALYALSRIIYAMSTDGLIPRTMGKLHPRFQTPFIGTLTAGLATGILSAVFKPNQLANMMSIGTLLAYSVVAICVLILRYKESEAFERRIDRDPRTFTIICKQLINAHKLTMSTKLTSQISTWLIFIYVLLCILATYIIAEFSLEIVHGSIATIGLLSVIVLFLLLTLVFIYCQPFSEKKLIFAVPFVPFLPALSIFINMYLMMKMSEQLWIAFSMWLAIGLSIYFSYGVRHSKCRRNTY